MTTKFEKLRKIRKAKAMACGSIAFLLAPVGFGFSIMIGAAAAVVSVIYDIQSDKPDTEISLNELTKDETFNEISEYAILAAGCGVILATPIGLGVIGIAIKLALFIALRRVWHTAITKTGRTPYISKYWEFKFRAYDSVCTFKF